MRPLDLPGPEFLRFYLVVFFTVLGGAVLLRFLLRYPMDKPPMEEIRLSPYEVAHLRGGEGLVFDAAVTRLVHQGALKVDPGTQQIKTHDGGSMRGASGVDRAVYALVKGPFGGQLAAGRKAIAPDLEPVRQRLRDLELILSDSRAWMARFVPMTLLLLVPLLGVVKVFVGVSRGRPVFFLVLFCIVSVVAAILGLGRSVRRSCRGDRALKSLKQANAALEVQTRRRTDGLSGDDLVLALGLFGMGVLDTTPMHKVRDALKPPSVREGTTSCGSAVGCGDGGGGGGGCGSGCGGGGCGGCGGS